MAARVPFPATVGVLAMCALLPHSGMAADVEKNTTGLPTYPHLRRAIMDPVPRSTLGHQCTHYAAESGDPLETVEAWYRHALPGSIETDVNQDSPYGSYFKLTGIRLSNGNDFLTVYRSADGAATSIELFKCQAAASSSPAAG